jgi:CheY-like chemotaxis protein
MAIPSQTLQGLYILLLQNDSTFHQRLNAVLEANGAKVVTVLSLQAARQSLQYIRPHVLLCDDCLPDGNSQAFVQQFRTQDDSAKTLPIISLTDSALHWSDPAPLWQQGFQGAATQSFDIAPLIQLIQSVTQHPVLPFEEQHSVRRAPIPPLAS